MHLSLANLMFLPLAFILAPMINITAMYLGAVISYCALTPNWHSARWMIDLGVPSDIATGHLVFFVMQLPAIVALMLLGTGLFLLRNRHSDQIAVISFLALPFVDAYSFSCSMVETRSLLHEQSSTTFEKVQFASEYLHTQLLTAIVLLFAIATFILGRRRNGYAASTPRHTAIVYSSLAVLTVGSWTLWRMT